MACTTKSTALSKFAGELYDVYCEAVGGVSVRGDKLPTWTALLEDESKEKVVAGWMAVANRAIFNQTKVDRRF